MNQLETNLVLWAVCAILLFELLIIICLCRCFFNRIKPKRFYVKREEYEYLHGPHSARFQSTILRPPHADELALVGTLNGRNQISYNNGIPNLAYYPDEDDLRSIPQPHSLPPPPPSLSSTTTQYHPQQQLNWIEMRPSTGFINTSQLSPSDYDINSYQPPLTGSVLQLPPPPLIRQLHPTTLESHHDDIEDDDIDDDLAFHTLPPPNTNAYGDIIKRTDISTDTANYPSTIVVPKSILKGNANTPPLEVEQQSSYYNRPYSINDDISPQRSRTSSRHDGDISHQPQSRIPSTTISQLHYTEGSPRTSVKVNTDESIADKFIRIDYSVPVPTYEKRLPIESKLSGRYRMRYASVSQLNDVEWEVPREFQTIVYELSDEGQTIKGALLYDANNNNNKMSEKQKRNQRVSSYDDNRIEYESPSSIIHDQRSIRQRSQSAHDDDRDIKRTRYHHDTSHVSQNRTITDSDPYISRVFVPWDENPDNTKRKKLQQFNHTDEHGDEIQQAFEY
ncbi:unnamed protein product [Didymodactylos carnosus]|uniref:Uncharacterized protein n=1 Tax=Didymodactylos carnosus TaxID=1234261 RepID=A0A814FGK7_9BILA|nr:unnamed protein product [Didymodactylos carnosus]CAF3755045.1 unnamed protein product [Didymodactylos carnosus]